MTAQAERHKLEKRLDLLSKALHLLLFEEKEEISKKEAAEVRSGLSSYLRGNKEDFADLEDVLNAGSKNKQKGSKRDSPCWPMQEPRFWMLAEL